MKNLLATAALILLFISCDKEEVQDAIDNMPDTEAQIVYSAKMINPAGTASASDGKVVVTYRNNEGSNQNGTVGPGTVGHNSILAYPLTFKLGQAKKAILKVESNLFAKGWTIEAEITKGTKLGGIVSLKKQTLTADGEITVNID
jgi:hypothetical protein